MLTAFILMISHSIRVSFKMTAMIKYFTASPVLQSCIYEYNTVRKIQILYVCKTIDQVSNHFDPHETLNISASHPEQSYRDCCYVSSNEVIASGRSKNENVLNVKLFMFLSAVK